MTKFDQIQLVQQSDFTLVDIYFKYSSYWDIIDEIEEYPSRIVMYEKEVDVLYKALSQFIEFRSNYKKTIKDVICNVG